MKISVIGLGYVGAVSAGCLARRGHEVIGVDVNPRKVAMVNDGQAPVLEPGLPEAIADAVASGGLRATDDAAEAIRATDVSLICVGTPSGSQGSLSLDALERVCSDIGPALRDSDRRHTVVVRSTVLPGTTEETVVPALEASSGLKAGRDFGVAMNPEYLREGSGVADFDNPEKTVIGQLDAASGDPLVEIYGEPRGQAVPRSDPGRRGRQVRRQRLPRAQGRLRQRGGRAQPRVRHRLAPADEHLQGRPQAEHQRGVPDAGLLLRWLVPSEGPPRPGAQGQRSPRGRADPRERPEVERGPLPAHL